MAIDVFKNLAYSTLTVGIAAGAATLTVAAGAGAKFQVNSNITIWNVTDFTSPDLDVNAEIMRITLISTDTLTITKAQEGTADNAHNTGGKTYAVIQGITALNANKIFDKTGDTMTGVLNAIAGIGVNVHALVSTTYTVVAADCVIPFNPSGGAFNITLPAASAGKQLVIFTGKGTVNSMTVLRAGADTIDTPATSVAVGFSSRIALVSDGVSNWVRAL